METEQQQCPNLPDEIWLSIFSRVSIFDHHLDAISLVCKHFLTLTNNHLKRNLQILPSYPNPNTLPTLIRRFTNLRSINASQFHGGDLDALLCIVSQSQSPIKELDVSNQRRLPVDALVRFGKGIRVLKCCKIGILRGDDLVKVAEAMPLIRDLDVSYPENGCDHGIGIVRTGRGELSDAAIVEMSVRLPNLMRINVSGNPFVSDRAIVALARNCRLLREIVAVECVFVTQIGIAEAIRIGSNLASVSVSGLELEYLDSAIIMESSRSLSALHFSYLCVSDEFLCSLVETRLPLKQLTISSCFGFSLVGISSLVSAYQSLTCLNFDRMWCLTDEAMTGLVEFLPRLAYINLDYCKNVGHVTLFAILKFCRCIEKISMEHAGLGKGWVSTGDVPLANQSIRSLNVAGNLLPDEFTLRIALACPKLDVVDLSQCIQITATGIAGLLNSCREIRHLSLNRLCIDELMNRWDECKIEIIEMKGLIWMDDDQLDMLGSKCPNLLSVDLSDCMHLSANAVNKLVRKCTKLRQIRLDWCKEMSFRDLASMVFYRRSLRKIVFSNEYNSTLRLTANQKDVLLQHGCQVLGTGQHLARSFSSRIYNNSS